MFNKEYIDALKEIVNIGVGRGAENLNQLLNEHISLETPEVYITHIDRLKEILYSEKVETFSYISLQFSGDLKGRSKLIFPLSSAKKLAELFAKDFADSFNVNYARSGVLVEIGNIVINSIIGSLSNELKLHLSYNVPTYIETSPENVLKPVTSSMWNDIILCRTNFNVRKLQVSGEFVIFFEFGSLDILFNLLSNYINDSK
jgi:chemotaxis protein CheC